MKKIKKLLSILSLLIISLIFSPPIQASEEISVTSQQSEHTVATPFEKSFRWVIDIQNNDTKSQRVRMTSSNNQPPNGHVLAPVGYYDLEAGEKTQIVVTIEFDLNQEQTTSFTYSLNFEWDGGSEEIKTVVNKKSLDKEYSDNKIKTPLVVLDKNTQEPITNYFIITTFQSAIETEDFICENQKGTCDIKSLSEKYLKEISQRYNIDHKYDGQILQISAPGYKSYFNTNYLSQEEPLEVQLEPLTQVGTYSLSKTISTDFSIWWIKASEDEKSFAFSQGTHGSPEIESPETTAITMTDSEGNTIWQNTASGECWGLDISPNGQYVAAGCHGGSIYVWNRDGNLYLEHKNNQAFPRWVKFSPDSKYLVTGPVNNTPEAVGLFDIASKKILYTLDIGSYLREARFSEDGKTMYLASANGQLFSVKTEDGSKVWTASGGYYIPFVLGSSVDENIIITGGKGRSLRAFDLSSGEMLWETAVDQTITAGEVAENGTVISNTVGGMAYAFDSEGEITWARNYGGVGHNAVYYTYNGKYALFGGPNPTLFDSQGNVLWQREKDKDIQMSGPTEINTGAAYVSWVSNDASLLILGGDDGKIDFYKGSINEDVNTYSQYTGVGEVPQLNSSTSKDIEKESRITKDNIYIFGGIGIVLLASTVTILLVTTKKKNNKDTIESKTTSN